MSPYAPSLIFIAFLLSGSPSFSRSSSTSILSSDPPAEAVIGQPSAEMYDEVRLLKAQVANLTANLICADLKAKVQKFTKFTIFFVCYVDVDSGM